MSRERLESLPDDLEALLFMAQAQLLKGDIADAQSLLDPVCLRLIFLSRAFKLLGDACSGVNPDLASDHYRRYIAINPESDDAVELQAKLESDAAPDGGDGLNTGFRTLTMADLMVKQGHIDTAREMLEEILSREPDNQQALVKLDKVRLIRELEKLRQGLTLGKTKA
jgi:tetratricopeptide (TPR) repeat protein